MSEVVKRNPLGRGLASLLGEQQIISNPPLDINTHQIQWLNISQLTPSPYQPRKIFNEQALEQLATSIESQGILQPLLVRALNNDRYEIVAGERRWRAAQRAQHSRIPVIKVNYTDQQVMEVALIENIQRENLNPIEEAESYKRLIENHSYTQENLAKIIGKSRSHIANMLRLLTLPPKIQDLMMQGVISMGHARALLSLEDPEDMVNEILKKGLSVRQVERLTSKNRKTSSRVEGSQSDDQEHLENQIEQLIGLKTSLQLQGDGGIIQIAFKNFQELDLLMSRLHSLQSLSA